MGNLLSGLAGTLPNTTYSTSISLAEVTGIGARRVGVAIGVIFLLVAFLPKFTALLIAIPSPVAAYLVLLVGILFVQGMKIVIQEGVDHRKAVVVGLSFWIGTAFQNGWVFPDLLGDGFLGVLLGNDMTSGAIVAVILMTLLELTGPRRRRLEVSLDPEALPNLTEFLRAFASRSGWNRPSTERLVLVAEETLMSLLAEDEDDPVEERPRRLIVTARKTMGGAELEFVSAGEEANLEDRLSYLGESPDIPDGRDISFRLLRHYASSVRHQKYHGVDIVTVNVVGSG